MFHLGEPYYNGLKLKKLKVLLISYILKLYLYNSN